MISPNKHQTCYDAHCFGDIGRNGFRDTVIDNVKASFELSPDYKDVYIVEDSSKQQEFLHDDNMANSHGLPMYGAWVYEGNEDRKTTGRKYIQMCPYDVPILQKGDYVCFDFYLRGKKSTWLVTALDSKEYYEQVGSMMLCTNELRFYNEYGKLLKIPCVFNDDINSEKNVALANMLYINGIVTIYLQLNEDSQQIHPNQRFLFGQPGNWTAFKVVSVGVNNFMNEVFWDDKSAHLMELTIEASYVNELTDDLVLGVADANVFNLSVDISSITNKVGFETQLQAELYRNGVPYSLPLQWKSENEDIATVDENGLVKLVGEGQTVITVYMVDNESVYYNIAVDVVPDDITPPVVQDIVIYPSDGNKFGILQGSKQVFSCYMYVDGIEQNNAFDFTLDTEVPKSSYGFAVVDDNHFVVENKRMNNHSHLKVTCTDRVSGASKIIDIKLKGAW